jgi:hypothetical protein
MLKFLLLSLIISYSSVASSRPDSNVLIEKDHYIGSTSYWIVKPAGNFSSPLPVVYFLHGRGGDRLTFKHHEGVVALENHLKMGGTPFAVVGLTGTKKGKDSYWINKTRDDILNKIIPKIEAKYSIGGNNNRMIAGISMGSHGAFQMALTSNLFKCVAGHSLVLRDYESMSGQFPGLFGTREEFATRDPISLINKVTSSNQLAFKKAWLDIGGRDAEEFVTRSSLMEAELLRLDFNPEFLDVGKIYPDGAHDSSYWKFRMTEYVAWYGECFKN